MLKECRGAPVERMLGRGGYRDPGNEDKGKDMTKARISILVEVEYELESENYPAGSSPEDMLAIDVAGANADPYLTMDAQNAKWTISGELLKA